MNKFFTRCLTLGLVAALTLTTAAASAETVKIAYGDNAIDTARVIKILEGEGFLEVDPSVGYSAELKDALYTIGGKAESKDGTITIPAQSAGFYHI